jgi:hypothetical protein
MGWLWRVLFVVVAIGILLWGALALHFAGPRAGANILPSVWAVSVVGILVFVRPFGRRVAVLVVAAAALFD